MSLPAAYVGLILIWASTPLAIKWSTPVGFVFASGSRMLLGALICLSLLWWLRLPLPWHAQARRSYLAVALTMFAAMMCVYWGSQYISSGLVSVLFGLLPLVTTVLSALFLRQASLGWNKLLGLVVAMSGLVVIFNPQDGVSLSMLLGVLAVLLSVLLNSISMLWVKHIAADLPPLSLTAGGLLLALPAYLLSWWVLDGSLHTDMTVQTGLSILYLSVFGSVLGFVLMYYILKRLSATAIAISALITPVVALILGQQLNNEVVSAHIVAGAALILAGLMLHHWGHAVVAVRDVRLKS